MTGASVQNPLEGAKRIVVKIGSALLVDAARGTLRQGWLESLAGDIAAARMRGQEVLLVSSGAIALGRRRLDLPPGKLKLEDSQAAAAAGMIGLAHAYETVLGRHDLFVAQVLLTLEDTENRRRYLNARNTVTQLLKRGAVPLINENDTVATDEIRFGDNDRLAARVAAMVSADVLLLLSSVDGLYERDPGEDAGALHIPEIRGEVGAGHWAMAGGGITQDGSGGMHTKLEAARMALKSGCRMAIFDGREDGPIRRLEAGARATWFVPDATPVTARKQWISGSLNPSGVLIIDAGAEAALKDGNSLLPAGVAALEGAFQRGDAVRILTQDGRELARGLVAYAAGDAEKILGARSGDIEARLGFRGRTEIVHRDDLVLL